VTGLPDRIELEEYIMEYATAELMEECITVEGLVQESAKWPDGFNLEGPDDDGKYFFVRKPPPTSLLPHFRALRASCVVRRSPCP